MKNKITKEEIKSFHGEQDSPELTAAINFVCDYRDGKIGDNYVSTLSLAQMLVEYAAQFKQAEQCAGVLPSEVEIIAAMKEEFSLGLTGDTYEKSANKQIIDNCVKERYDNFVKVLDLVRSNKLNIALKDILKSHQSQPQQSGTHLGHYEYDHKKGTSKFVSAEQESQSQPQYKPVMITCPKCKGKKQWRSYGGGEFFLCDRCNGKGKIESQPHIEYSHTYDAESGEFDVIARQSQPQQSSLSDEEEIAELKVNSIGKWDKENDILEIEIPQSLNDEQIKALASKILNGIVLISWNIIQVRDELKAFLQIADKLYNDNMERLTEVVCDLNYGELIEFLHKLSIEINLKGTKEFNMGHQRIGRDLLQAADYIRAAVISLEQVLQME